MQPEAPRSQDGAAQPAAPSRYDRLDWALAALIGIAALAAYVRTLAPDLLYADSAEFQTLAYTLGITHSTGYPIYLLLARLLGLLPLGTLAWRVNLLSALGAAVTVGGVYLWARRLTENRIGPLLGCLVMAISYTFWSQAILAEVYTPALAIIVVAMLGLFHWIADPAGRRGHLLGAALLLGAGLGVHASVGLFIPPAAALILWRLRDPALDRRARLRPLWTAAGGGLIGLTLFVGAFLLLDTHDPPSSFINTALIPSRTIWGLSRTALARPWTRFWITVTGLQWQTAMFADSWAGMRQALMTYGQRLTSHEVSRFTLLLALIGAATLIARLVTSRTDRVRRAVGGYTLGAYIFAMALLLNYRPPDWHVFLLPVHVLLAVAAGAGAGMLLQVTRALVDRHTAAEGPSTGRMSNALLVAIMLLGITSPFIESRLNALTEGRAHFSEENYVYPVDDPDEPRLMATIRVSLLPDRALVLLNWRTLYAVTYLAHVEGRRPHIITVEATPHGSDGRIAESLLATIEETLALGIPVYTDERYEPLSDHFHLSRAISGTMFRIELP